MGLWTDIQSNPAHGLDLHALKTIVCQAIPSESFVHLFWGLPVTGKAGLAVVILGYSLHFISKRYVLQGLTTLLY